MEMEDRQYVEGIDRDAARAGIEHEAQLQKLRDYIANGGDPESAEANKIRERICDLELKTDN